MVDHTELESYEPPESLFELETAEVSDNLDFDEDWDVDEEKVKGKPLTFWEKNKESIQAILMVGVILLSSFLFLAWVFSWNDEYEAKVEAIKIALETGEIKYPEAELIELGTVSSASPGEITDIFVEGKQYIPERMPTRWVVNQCQSFRLPSQAEGVFVVAASNVADEVHVSLPIYTSGSANICVTGGHAVEVLVWLP